MREMILELLAVLLQCRVLPLCGVSSAVGVGPSDGGEGRQLTLPPLGAEHRSRETQALPKDSVEQSGLMV